MKISAKGVSFSYGKTRVLSDIDAEFEGGKFTAILGGNGAGKSTLLKILSGWLKPDCGAVFYDSQNIARLSARRLSDEETKAALPSLVAVSKLDPEEMKAELLGYVEKIADLPLRSTVLYALNETETFFTSVAAVKMHHAHMYGLLEHSLKMARMASALLPLYPFIDSDLSLAGCILHDIGKTVEYTQGFATERTKVGILQGHVVLGYRIVRRAGIKNSLAPDILARLEHIILSHQGEPEWGAAVRAATPEAVFVSTIDNFDAKMGALETALDSSEGMQFVEVPALKVKMLADSPDYGEDSNV